jgi:hypothetical protein
MSSIASLPILVLVPSPSQTEREIDRRVLLDIAADRESLIASGKSIEEMRQILKLRTGPIAGYVSFFVDNCPVSEVVCITDIGCTM